jgi:hypothetical protein
MGERSGRRDRQGGEQAGEASAGQGFLRCGNRLRGPISVARSQQIAPMFVARGLPARADVQEQRPTTARSSATCALLQPRAACGGLQRWGSKLSIAITRGPCPNIIETMAKRHFHEAGPEVQPSLVEKGSGSHVVRQDSQASFSRRARPARLAGRLARLVRPRTGGGARRPRAPRKRVDPAPERVPCGVAGGGSLAPRWRYGMPLAGPT